MDEIAFLSTEDVVVLHRESIEIEGGMAGVRDAGLLESAVAMPRQRFGGVYVHDTLEMMAAAYLYHIAMNHPFHDGNKRAAVIAALVFLRENGYELITTNEALEELTLSVARSERNKESIAAFLREHMQAC